MKNVNTDIQTQHASLLAKAHRHARIYTRSRWEIYFDKDLNRLSEKVECSFVIDNPIWSSILQTFQTFYHSKL